jgi:hypothetical protein
MTPDASRVVAPEHDPRECDQRKEEELVRVGPFEARPYGLRRRPRPVLLWLVRMS